MPHRPVGFIFLTVIKDSYATHTVEIPEIEVELNKSAIFGNPLKV